MSEKFIPEHIDPFRFAEQGLQLEGAARYAEMQRLSASLHHNDGAATVSLQFGSDEQGITFIKGSLKAVLELQCQRCMDPMKYEIITDFRLGIVNTLDEANALPKHYEPALANDGHLALRELIEDEIILNLPIIPRHAVDECKIKLPLREVNLLEDEEERSNPFQVLESLKH